MRSWGHEELTEGNDITLILGWGTTKKVGKNSYLKLGGLQNKSGEKLISKVRRTTKNMEKKLISQTGRTTK
jgi:hypothetical protein